MNDDCNGLTQPPPLNHKERWVNSHRNSIGSLWSCQKTGVGLIHKIDVSESLLATSASEALEILLSDMTTGKNIIWATENYSHLGSQYASDIEITVEAITGPNEGIIQPRVLKSRGMQLDRTKAKAEVFTPSWLCNEQNNQVDDAWFGRACAFNSPTHHGWVSRTNPIQFDEQGERTWKRYVDERRLEVACGEAPYLVSRYDTTTGVAITLNRRIGLLDRKMRVVAENTSTQDEWLEWARRAFESVYGYEFQGDSLLLARENLLASYADYLWSAHHRKPSEDELARIARIVVWNTWQMDAFTNTIPFQRLRPSTAQNDFFADESMGALPCLVQDWRANQIIEYRSLLAGGQTR